MYFKLQREEIDVVLDRDGAIKGYDASPIIFTDITFGVHDRDRIIVVREPDGTLREASWEQRDRVNNVYFPTEERKFDVPAMFEPEELKNILGIGNYVFDLVAKEMAEMQKCSGLVHRGIEEMPGL